MAPPATPLNLNAGNEADQAILLEWDRVSGATGYKIKRSTTDGGPYVTLAATPTNADPAFLDEGLAYGTTYYYRIYAFNQAGISPDSNQASATSVPPPAAPTNLEAEDVGNEIDLTWNLVSGATGYRIRRSTTNGGPYTTLDANATMGRYTDDEVLQGTTYYYRVYAINQVGNGPDSNQASVTIPVPPPPPPAPTNLQAVAGDKHVELTWTAVTGATEYKVYAADADANAVVFEATVNSTRFTHGQLTNGKIYHYRVLARTASGYSLYSNQVSATPIGKPLNLTATAGNAQVVLKWNAVSGATGYKIKRSTTNGGPYTTLNDEVTGTSYTNGGLTNGTPYYYRVYAINMVGVGPDSEQASATPIALPSAPHLYAANNEDDQAILLEWESVSGATGYKIKRSTTNNGPYVTLADAPTGTNTGFLDEGLAYGTTYYYRVYAFNQAGIGPDSNQASATSVPPPSAPLGLTATPADHGEVLLQWNVVSGADGYKIKRSTNDGGPYTTLAAAPTGTENAFLDEGLTPGTTYYYRVYAFNQPSIGPDSDQASATPVPPPAAPTDVQAVAGNANVRLTWSTVTTATSYTVYAGTNPSAVTQLATVTGTNFLHQPLTNGTTYYYKVIAGNASGNSPFSNQVNATPVAPVTPTPTPTPVPVPYLTALTLNPSTVVGGSNSTGTVTLSAPAPAGGATIVLKTTGNLALPTNVQIAAGATTANFQVRTAPVPETITVPVTATYRDFMQAADLTILKSGQSYDVLDLIAIPGNSIVTLSWSDLPIGTVQGYNVYRKVGAGAATKLNTTVVKSTDYVDSGLTNGTTYQYQIFAVAHNGIESGESDWVSATPSASIPTLNWVNPPSSITGETYLYATASSGPTPSTGYLVVDGERFVDATSSSSQGQTNRLAAPFDSTRVPNGIHKIQMIGNSESDISTPVLTVQVSNDPLVTASLYCDSMFAIDEGEVMHLNATLPSQTTFWKVDIVDQSDDSATVVRSWTGSSSSIQLVWDGKNSLGTMVETGMPYVVRATWEYTTPPPAGSSRQDVAASAVGQQNTGVWGDWVTPTFGNMDCLALVNAASSIGNGAGGRVDQFDQGLARAIARRLKSVKAAHPNFQFSVIYDNDAPIPVKSRGKIFQWMRSSVTDFYIFSHGSPGQQASGPFCEWGGISFFSEIDSRNPKPPLNFNNPIDRTIVKRYQNSRQPNPRVFDVPYVTQGRQYNFAWIDTCNSAGGLPPDFIPPQATPDLSWSRAFNIGSDGEFFSAFLGWNGSMGLNNDVVTVQGPQGPAQQDAGIGSGWFHWRLEMWKNLTTSGRFTSQAVNVTNSRVRNSGYPIWPTDSGRLVLDGDTVLP